MLFSALLIARRILNLNKRSIPSNQEVRMESLADISEPQVLPSDKKINSIFFMFIDLFAHLAELVVQISAFHTG